MVPSPTSGIYCLVVSVIEVTSVEGDFGGGYRFFYFIFYFYSLHKYTISFNSIPYLLLLKFYMGLYWKTR